MSIGEEDEAAGGGGPPTKKKAVQKPVFNPLEAFIGSVEHRYATEISQMVRRAEYMSQPGMELTVPWEA